MKKKRAAPEKTKLAAALRERKEAIEQQKATSAILRAISRAYGNPQPVFDAILKNALRLCGAHLGVLNLWNGVSYRTVAQWGATGRFARWLFERGDWTPVRFSMPMRMVREKRPIQAADLRLEDTYRKGSLTAVKFVDEGGTRTYLTVPLLRGGEVVGAIAVYRSEVRPFTARQVHLLQTFADQAVIAIENARLFNETKEALERQTATADILRIISRSPTEVQPVFDAVAERAAIICGATQGGVLLASGNELRRVAYHGPKTKSVHVPLRKTLVNGRAFLERRTIHVPDILAVLDKEYPDARENQKRQGFRSLLSVPMLRKGQPIGTINVWRTEVRPFSPEEIKLLETFADQAVIAIENTRLFNETKEALEQQTATSEVLKTISRSTFDLDAVLRVLIENATRLAGAKQGFIFRFDGKLARLAYSHNAPQAYTALIEANPIPPGRGSLVGRTLVERRAVHIPDVLADKEFTWHEAQRLGGFRAMLGVPMMREGNLIGVIAMWSDQVGPFSAKQIELVSTFADQAVIAIENVRLFNETKEALERQTATADILKVIASSPSDVQPVFEAIARSAKRLLGGHASVVRRVIGDSLRLAAFTSTDVSGDAAQRERADIPLRHSGSLAAKALRTGTAVIISDVETDSDVSAEVREIARVRGYRSYLTVPMVRVGTPIGTISVTRREAGTFSDHQIAILRTFADQAVIAIENVRLFNETKEALERQTATAEILKVISSSTTDTQPVFEAIVRSAAQLFSMSNASIFMRDGDLTRLHAVQGTTVDDAQRKELGSIYPIPFNPEVSSSARAMVERRINFCLDTEAPDVPEHIRRAGRAGRFRSNTVVPLVREGEGIGTIVITHPEPGHRLNEKQLALLQTFADQAVIAIENVRLFNETKEALEQQTATAEILKVISSSPTDVQPVLDAVAMRAELLCEGGSAIVYLRDGEVMRRVAFHGPLVMGQGAQQLSPQSVSGRAIIEKRTVHVPDLERERESYPVTWQVMQESLRGKGVAEKHSMVSVPMIKEDEAIGAIMVRRREVRPFNDKQIALLQTFADQAVIAIENVRLFGEIQDKSKQLEIANKHKSEFLANMSHELRTPLNAIIGFSEVLMEKMFGEVNEKQADYLKDIHESGTHLLSLINDILDLSKIEAGRMELDLGSFHLPTAISNAMTLIRERAQRHGVRLGSEIDSRLGEFRADERKFKQILLNLLSNAVKFTPEGGRVEVSAKLDTDKVEIAVKDTGVGISTEDQQRLFEEFRQVGKDNRRKAEGTGLGLALTKKFVELHGGEIRVASTPGMGSTFTCLLPIRS